MKIFNLPDLGEGLPNAEIHKWYVKEGDIVKVDDLMVAMETAKAVVDVPAPFSGKIVKIFGQAGDTIQTGAPLVGIAIEENVDSVANDQGTVAGSLEVGNKILNEAPTGIQPKQTSVQPTAQTLALPAIRALAKQLNVNINQVVGTGPRGQITTKDIELAAQQNIQQSTQSSIPQGFEPLRGVRRSMAQTMIASHRDVVATTIVDDAILINWTAQHNVTLRIIHALIHACQTEPALNAWYDNSSMSQRLFSEVNLGLAVDSNEGLFVPVIHHAEQKSNDELRAIIENYKTQINNRTLPSEALRGATIMLSNFGTFAGRYANPILVPPVVAILGAGRIRDEVVAQNGKPLVGRVLPLSLTFDHRAVTGGEATRFLASLIQYLEKA